MTSRFALSMKQFGLSVVFMILAAGCGGDSDAFKGPFGQVTGKVTFEGKPIPEGSRVVFQSTKEGYLATGTVNAAGEYTLQCNGKPDLPALPYQVQIMPPSKAAAATTGMIDPAVGAKVDATVVAPPFPAKYSAVTKELVYTVKEGKNTADFPLTK